MLCDPMDCSMPGLSVPHHLPKFAQVHVHCISDAAPAILSSDALFSFCPQSFPALGTFPMSQLFISDDQNTRVSASVIIREMQIKTTVRYHLTAVKWPSSQNLQTINAGVGLEKKEPS